MLRTDAAGRVVPHLDGPVDWEGDDPVSESVASPVEVIDALFHVGMAWASAEEGASDAQRTDALGKLHRWRGSSYEAAAQALANRGYTRPMSVRALHGALCEVFPALEPKLPASSHIFAKRFLYREPATRTVEVSNSRGRVNKQDRRWHFGDLRDRVRVFLRDKDADYYLATLKRRLGVYE